MQNQRTIPFLHRLWHGADYNYEQWLDMPEILDEDFWLMQATHCNIMSVGIFSWAMLEPEEGVYQFDWLDELMDRLAEHNIAAALATPSAAPPAWLSQKYPETRRVNQQKQREPHQRRQNFCYTSPIYRQKIGGLNRRLAERYGRHPALHLWHLSNEYTSIPCYCDLCYHAFRDWLQVRYGDLDALNRAWWATFWSHRYTSWEQIEPVDASMEGLLLDWQRFTSDQALDFLLAEAQPLRELTPEIPITTNFMQPDVGLNYWHFAEQLDVISWDSYPRWHQSDDTTTAIQTAFYHDLQRSFKGGQPFLLMELTPSLTSWQGISRLKRPGMHKLSSLQAIAHGANSVQYFQWRQSRGGEEKFHGAVLSHLGQAELRVVRDVSEVGNILAQLADLPQTTMRAQVALVYDFENEWALDFAHLPRSLAKNYQQTCMQHYAPFWQNGVSVDMLSADSDLGGYRLVIAPMLYMLRPGAAERIETFVKAGGVFVTTYLSGLVNESDLCFINGFPPALRRTLGIYVEELDTLTDDQMGTITPCADNALGLSGSYCFQHFAELVHGESAQTLAAYSSEFYAGYPALTVNAYGQGQAYYIAARTDEQFLVDFYGSLMERLRLENPLGCSLPAGMTVQSREDDQRRFAFLMNFSGQPQSVEVGADWRDALTAEVVDQPIRLQPYDIVILMQAKA